MTPKEKNERPALILEAQRMGTFFGVGPKHAISEEARTFLVAFPGLNISKVPGARDKGIAAAVKKKRRATLCRWADQTGKSGNDEAGD